MDKQLKDMALKLRQFAAPEEERKRKSRSAREKNPD
jgi:hypothetical protein